VPVLVTEHGLGHSDDTLRAALIPPALEGLLGAIDDGVPVLGYLHWTLMDNFEWIFGYDVKFGLHEVDRQTFARTPKPSAAVYSAIARANAVELPAGQDQGVPCSFGLLHDVDESAGSGCLSSS
jgi:beta-glucosidase